MKILNKILYSFLAIVLLTSCGDKSQNKSEEESVAQTEEIRMKKPVELGMNADSLAAKVQEQAIGAVESLNDQKVTEASEALAQVYVALDALEAKNTKGALAALEKSTGKLNILLARKPDLALVPIDVSVKTIDLVADLETIRNIKRAAIQALKEDYFQVMRDELAKLASELQITKVELPLATFPEAMKSAAALIDKGKTDEAKVVLYTALNTLVVSEERIPLPILRAQALIAQAITDDASKDKKKKVLALLDNAEYQLIMAEELGYGDRDREYKELNKAIKELKKSVKDDGDSQALFEKFKTKLADFKKRIAS
ncbi:YfdX family protein [Chryseobacterium sp. RR2-3-20]|uniref:YfdX family protein n=1 Tax=Chryseobacterium sp. RR2-3-20 TaxID=2787626 RepID=UPI001AE080B9|nr:YfdX family protein [Chryseobacterium sp. RR2-3-20]